MRGNILLAQQLCGQMFAKLTSLTMGLPSLMRVSKVFPTLWSMLAASSVDPPSFEFRTYVPSANTPAALTYRVQRSNT